MILCPTIVRLSFSSADVPLALDLISKKVGVLSAVLEPKNVICIQHVPELIGVRDLTSHLYMHDVTDIELVQKKDVDDAITKNRRFLISMLVLGLPAYLVLCVFYFAS